MERGEREEGRKRQSDDHPPWAGDEPNLLSTRHNDDLPRKVRNVILGIETLRKETTHLYIVLTKEASRK